LENLARRRPEFELGPADAEAAKLKKFSDAGKIKVSGCPTTPKLQLSSGRSIYRLWLKNQFFEPRSVYFRIK